VSSCFGADAGAVVMSRSCTSFAALYAIVCSHLATIRRMHGPFVGIVTDLDDGVDLRIHCADAPLK
jgi:hypothetical protein